MRIAYFDCASGISGDMSLGALVDAGARLERVRGAIASLGLGQVIITAETVKKCGFRALQIQIMHPPEHAHRHLHEIEAMFARAALEPAVREKATAIFRAIGEAEAKVHGVDLQEVHFHEVGAIDSIVDIVGVAVALVDLGIDAIEASPVPTGQGTILIDHGRVSVPAPATAELLRGIPLAPSEVSAELTTPTGAGILRSLCRRFGAAPAMTIERIGYGAGMKDFPRQPNVLRVLIGTVGTGTGKTHPDATQGGVPQGYEYDRVWLMETNIDDSPPADIAICAERLLAEGALDVWQTPCMMKKGRAGTTLSWLATEAKAELLERIVFDAGLTIGIRRKLVERHKLRREAVEVQTLFGAIAGKVAWLPSGGRTFTPEWDALKRAAAAHGVSVRQVREAALRSAAQSQN